MQLRIHRTWKWVPATVDPTRIQIGGKIHYILIPQDELQGLINGKWVPIPIVEEPRPEHPDAQKPFIAEVVITDEMVNRVRESLKLEDKDVQN